MDNFFDWLWSAIVPIVKRVLSALGIGWVSYESMGALFDSLRGAILSAWGGMPAQVLQVLELAGFGVALGIILGAIAARLAFLALGWLGKVVA